ncbi:iron complex transport system substrate-binding protein [Paenibacillus tianmuensis]|uniref:Iron complex transport system substrate-binding protein n=1 Tax=Paenibacillus tianmuensis TaxID=624147 RepID=A0A1G4S3N0_9BACL|nr:iron-siderophore ABC transporter substrate-binding protein [Paenibacillus tianmuensis]SCW63265.1 iron complex transport system substrate-binding protein [Paenibacillus tianmuensis]
MSRSMHYVLLVFCCAMLFIAGCGTANPNTSSAPKAASGTDAKKPEQASTQEQAKSQDPAVRTIKHLIGTTEIKGTPQRIVALEWSVVEDVLALGVQPVGIADLADYKKWVKVKHELSPDVKDLGSRSEPSLEQISALKPDLIIATNRVEAFYDKLKAIAPTIVFYPNTEKEPDAYAIMEKNFRIVADALSKKDEGEKVLKEVDAAIAGLAEKVKKAGKVDSEFILVQAFSMKKAPTMRIMSDNAMSAKVLIKLGLKNAFKPKGYVQTFEEGGVEPLLAMKKANFFYIVQDNDNIFANQLKENPVWKNLDFVKENRIYAMGGDTWLFGGPLSAQLIAEKATAAMTK